MLQPINDALFVAGDDCLHIFQWVVRKKFAKCFTAILKTITMGAPGMEFPGHHFMDHCSSPTYWYSVLVFHLSSLWESSSCAKYGQHLLWASGILRMLPFTMFAGLHWWGQPHQNCCTIFFFFIPIPPHPLKCEPGRKRHRRQRIVVYF